jgi:hypothetical protein
MQILMPVVLCNINPSEKFVNLKGHASKALYELPSTVICHPKKTTKRILILSSFEVPLMYYELFLLQFGNSFQAMYKYL